MLSLANLLDYTVFCGLSLKASERVIKRFIIFNFYLAH